MATTTTGAEGVDWTLDDLYAGPDDPALESDLGGAVASAQAFRERYRERVASLGAPELNEATAELERIRTVVARVEIFAYLRFAADTSDEARGALVQRAREVATAVETELLFFELEWAAVEDARANEVLASPALEHYRNVLRARRRYRPHLLSEPEERIDAEKRITGVDAWTRLFDELIGELRVRLDGDDVMLDAAIARLFQETNQGRRREVAEAVTETLAPGLRARGYILNTVLNERAVEDRLRGYPRWISARNLDN